MKSMFSHNMDICRPFNPWPGSQYKTSKMERIDKFAEIVINGGIHCTVRRPRGQGNLEKETTLFDFIYWVLL